MTRKPFERVARATSGEAARAPAPSKEKSMAVAATMKMPGLYIGGAIRAAAHEPSRGNQQRARAGLGRQHGAKPGVLCTRQRWIRGNDLLGSRFRSDKRRCRAPNRPD